MLKVWLVSGISCNLGLRRGTLIYAASRCLAICIVLLLTSMACAAESPADALRMSILLNGTWDSCPMTSPQQIPTEGWQPSRVPAMPLAEADRPAGMWYRKSLSVPEAWLRPGRRIVLRLEKVGHYAAIYCNGQKVTEHYDQFTPIEADLTEHLKAGETNQLVVLAHEASGAFVRPGAPLSDEEMRFAYRPAGQGPTQRNWVGIVGDVSLSWRPADAIADVLITTSYRQKTLQIDAQFDGNSGDGAVCRATVLDGQKPALDLPAVHVNNAAARLSSPWQDFIPWNPPPAGEPKLYWLRVELVRDGQVVDRTFTRFGFREVWAEGNKLLLNGQRLFLNGTYHPWLDPITYNNDRRVIAQDLAAMQAAGINSLHGHWDDLGQSTLDLCDEMGVLVVNAFYCDGQLAIKPNVDELWPAWALKTTAAWAHATRGHPSIVSWRPFCALPRNLAAVQDMAKWPEQVRQAVREQAPFAMLADGTDIATYCQGAVKEDGQPETATRMAEFARNNRIPVLTNEIWASFTPFDAHATFLRDYYRQAWDSGSAGFIIQHIPYCLPDPPFTATWLSASGVGGRADGWMIKRRVNWCDPSKPAWTLDQYGALLRDLTTEITGKPPTPFAGKTVGELLVHAAADAPVFLLPAGPTQAAHSALLPASDGTAWFVVSSPGTYRVVQGDRALSIDVAPQLTAPPPGYGAVQHVQLPK